MLGCRPQMAPNTTSVTNTREALTGRVRRLSSNFRQPSGVWRFALAAALVHGMVDSFYFWPDIAIAFWLLVGTSELLTQAKDQSAI